MHEPWPVQFLVAVSQLFSDWKQCGIVSLRAGLVASGCAAGLTGDEPGFSASTDSESRRRISVDDDRCDVQSDCFEARLDSGMRTMAASSSPLDTYLARRPRFDVRVLMISGVLNFLQLAHVVARVSLDPRTIPLEHRT